MNAATLSILLFDAFHGLILTCYLWLRGVRKNSIPSRLLAGVLFFVTVQTVLMAPWLSKEYMLSHSYLLGLESMGAGLGIFVFLYLYIKAQVTEDFRLTYRCLIPHCMIIGLGFILNSPYWFMSQQNKVIYISSYFESGGFFANDLKVFIYFSTVGIIEHAIAIIYITLCVAAILKHQRQIREKFSSIEKIKLNWLLVLLSIAVIDTIIVLLSFLSRYFPDLIFIAPNHLVLMIIISLNILLFGSAYMGLLQTDIYREPSRERVKKDKYEKSGLSQERVEKIAKSLEDHMADKKPYTDNGLTLSKLAESLELNSNHLSQVINQYFKTSFYDFINTYRINETIRLSKGNVKKSNLLEIALASGFNSYSTFYTHFKRVTGKAPKAYFTEE